MTGIGDLRALADAEFDDCNEVVDTGSKSIWC